MAVIQLLEGDGNMPLWHGIFGSVIQQDLCYLSQRTGGTIQPYAWLYIAFQLETIFIKQRFKGQQLAFHHMAEIHLLKHLGR